MEPSEKQGMLLKSFEKISGEKQLSEKGAESAMQI